MCPGHSTIGWRRDRSRARLDADLATPALDLSESANFDLRGLLTRTFGASDGSLRLDAAAITLGHAEAKTDSSAALTSISRKQAKRSSSMN